MPLFSGLTFRLHYNIYSYALEAEMYALKLRAIGTSTGVVLPKDMLAHLHTEQGQEVYAIQTPTGFMLTTLDPRIKDQVEKGEALMERYKDTFAALAK